MSIWNAERDEYIRANRLTMSAATIAKNLGNGITRHAVIGRAYRLKLDRLKLRSSPERPMGRPKVNFNRTGPSKPPVFMPPPPEPQPSFSIDFFDLAEGHCRFPTSGEGYQTLFCGHPQTHGLPYCPGHCAIAYTKPKPPSPHFAYVIRKGMPKVDVLRNLDAA